MNTTLLIDIVGWIGAAALLTAYALVSTGRVAGGSLTYQLLNMFGGTLLIANSFYYGAYPSVGVNVVWIIIALYAIARGARHMRRPDAPPADTTRR